MDASQRALNRDHARAFREALSGKSQGWHRTVAAIVPYVCRFLVRKKRPKWDDSSGCFFLNCRAVPLTLGIDEDAAPHFAAHVSTDPKVFKSLCLGVSPVGVSLEWAFQTGAASAIGNFQLLRKLARVLWESDASMQFL